MPRKIDQTEPRKRYATRGGIEFVQLKVNLNVDTDRALDAILAAHGINSRAAMIGHLIHEEAFRLRQAGRLPDQEAQ